MSKLEKKLEEQKQFYEDALEKRFNQMEEFEERAERAEADLASARRDLREANERVDELEGENFNYS